MAPKPDKLGLEWIRNVRLVVESVQQRAIMVKTMEMLRGIALCWVLKMD
jgi:hypothetical protein